jgi:hypothetical protein
MPGVHNFRFTGGLIGSTFPRIHAEQILNSMLLRELFKQRKLNLILPARTNSRFYKPMTLDISGFDRATERTG